MIIELIEGAERGLYRRNEHLSRGAAIDMHFIEYLAIGLDLDLDRRECSRNRCRRQQHLAEEIDRLGRADAGDCPHVPNHWALCIQIRRADQQDATAIILRRDQLQKFTIDEFRDQCGERRGVGERWTTQQPRQQLSGDQFAGFVLGPYFT